MDERKSKEIKAVEQSCQLDLTVEKRGRKDLENKIMKQVDETCFALRLDLAREKKLREEVNLFSEHLLTPPQCEKSTLSPHAHILDFNSFFCFFIRLRSVTRRRSLMRSSASPTPSTRSARTASTARRLSFASLTTMLLR